MELTTKELFILYELYGLAFVCEDGEVARAVQED